MSVKAFDPGHAVDVLFRETRLAFINIGEHFTMSASIVEKITGESNDIRAVKHKRRRDLQMSVIPLTNDKVVN